MIDLDTHVTKVDLPFLSHIHLELRDKRAWAGVVKWWVTYREVIRDTVRVRPKHGERSCGDCRVSRQDSRALKKLMDRPSDGMGPTCRESRRGWPISRGRSGCNNCTDNFVSIMNSLNFDVFIFHLKLKQNMNFIVEKKKIIHNKIRYFISWIPMKAFYISTTTPPKVGNCTIPLSCHRLG